MKEFTCPTCGTGFIEEVDVTSTSGSNSTHADAAPFPGDLEGFFNVSVTEYNEGMFSR